MGKIIIAFLAAAVLGACSKSTADMSQRDVYTWDYGVVVEPDKHETVVVQDRDEGEFTILRDDGVRLIVVENFWTDYVPRVGDRVYFSYADEDYYDSSYDGWTQDVIVYHVTKIELRKPLTQSAIDNNNTQVVNDPITDIVELSFSGKYVNMVYEYPREALRDGDKLDGHTLDMVIDDTQAKEGEEVVIRIRHNARGDSPAAKPGVTMVNHRSETISFDLGAALEYADQSGRVTIRFEWVAYEGQTWESLPKSIGAQFDPTVSSTVIGQRD